MLAESAAVPTTAAEPQLVAHPDEQHEQNGGSVEKSSMIFAVQAPAFLAPLGAVELAELAVVVMLGCEKT